MKDENQQRLVLFDFDGTLTRYDSLFYFLRFFKGNLFFAYKMFLSLPSLIGYKLGLIDASAAKEELMIKFLSGTSVAEFDKRCFKFCQDIVPLILNEKIVAKFHQHKSDGDRVLIVSASIENWILPWARQWGVEVLGTKLAYRNNILTGYFDGNNCNGDAKVERIKAHTEITDYYEIWAYGDSAGDEAMFGLATKVVYHGILRN